MVTVKVKALLAPGKPGLRVLTPNWPRQAATLSPNACGHRSPHATPPRHPTMLAAPWDYTLTFSWGFTIRAFTSGLNCVELRGMCLKGALESDNVGAEGTSESICPDFPMVTAL